MHDRLLWEPNVQSSKFPISLISSTMLHIKVLLVEALMEDKREILIRLKNSLCQYLTDPTSRT